MGRGRAKAKQTKVARRLKYDTGGTDLDQLRAELIGEDGADGDDEDVDDGADRDDEELDGQLDAEDDAASR
jgi:hypothetical protein